MIGKITIGKSFRGCIAYCLNDKIQKDNHVKIIKNRADVLLFNKCFGNGMELAQQFNEVRQLNPKLSKPVLHVTLSFAPGEILKKDSLMEICGHCAKELGFDNNQFVAISHSDTDHQHLHIVANRVGFKKRTVSDSNNYKKIANFCRKMELKYELKQVLNPKKFLSPEQRNIPRFDQRKELLKQHIKDALRECYYFNQFEEAMKKRGYEIIKGRGISFADEKKVKVKGSQVNFSLQTIEKILEKKGAFQSIRYKNHSHTQKLLVQKDVTTPNKFQSSDNKSEVSKMIEQIMKPENVYQELNKHLLPKKSKKKKRQSYHL